MVNPIPDKVKDCLGELSASQQVTLRGYIGTLRAEIKGLEEQIRTLEDPDPHAHYHGHDKCTSDHGHDKAHHEKGHDHGHGNGNDHDGHKCEDEGHDHGHKDHSHEHHEHKKHDHGNEHEHKHEHHDHKHGHEKDEKPAAEESETPAWKKQALDQTGGNPMSLNWNVDKMEE